MAWTYRLFHSTCRWSGVINVAKACLEAKVPRLVVVSSGGVATPDSSIYKFLNLFGEVSFVPLKTMLCMYVPTLILGNPVTVSMTCGHVFESSSFKAVLFWWFALSGTATVLPVHSRLLYRVESYTSQALGRNPFSLPPSPPSSLPAASANPLLLLPRRDSPYWRVGRFLLGQNGVLNLPATACFLPRLLRSRRERYLRHLKIMSWKIQGEDAVRAKSVSH